MRWWLALLTCMVGVFTGDLCLYLSGAPLGRARALTADDPAALTGNVWSKSRPGYRRRGVLIVFLVRNVIGLRAAAFVAAGVVRVPLWKFAAADGAAIGYGVPLNFGLAYFFSRHLKAVLAEAHRVEGWIGLAVVLGGGVWLYFALRRRGERAIAGGSPAA